MHIHLDAVGGIAGDMFAAAMVDARPDLEAEVSEAVAALGLGDAVAIAFKTHGDGVLNGRRFSVTAPDPPHSTAAGALRERIAEAPLAPAVQGRALAMLDLLAGTEAEVHNVPVETVVFHELGGLDTLVDLVAAAAVIEASGATTWSCGALPRGRGRVPSAHGFLPVPTPATALLLKGMVLIDDGVDGERITPTGAAILRHLSPSQDADHTRRRLAAVGQGFGTRTLEGRSNVLRTQLYEAPTGAAMESGQVAVITFEVDDQTAEELALGLDRLRAADGVTDVTQQPVAGKDGRLAARVQVLAAPDQIEAVAERCFAETTTIGLRWTVSDRLVLRREMVTVDGGDGPIRVKVVERPGVGRTAKAELADSSAAAGAQSGRTRTRRAAEALALSGEGHGKGDD